MAEALISTLAGVGEGAFVDQPTDADQVLFLVGVADLVFQLVADVEVVFQRTLAAAGDDADLGKAGFQPPPPRTGSAACSPPAAFPWAWPWWPGGNECRNRRPGKDIS